MKIDVTENNGIVLKEVFNVITFENNYNEYFRIVMKDTGFQFSYNNILYEVKDDVINKISKPDPKYKYHVLTWGGFYNDEFKNIHKLEEGDFIFDTKEKRDKFINERKDIESKLNVRCLCFYETEGFCCDIRTVLHRVIEYGGKQYYTQYDIGINYPFEAAKYHLQNKWCPGFNDYPLGEDFDYTKVKIIKEWITGAIQELEWKIMKIDLKHFQII